MLILDPQDMSSDGRPRRYPDPVLHRLRIDSADVAAQEQCYDNLRISKNAWDTNLIKVGWPQTVQESGPDTHP